MRNPRGYHPRDTAPDATHMFSWLGKIFGRGAAADTGARGEALAADWLRRERGMTVVARNWRNPRDRRDELDLVCRDGEALVFVEVKTRAAGARVQGVHAVDARKLRVLRRAARAYLAGLPARPRTYRLDVVEVATAADGAAPVIRHFENLPLMGDGFRG